MITLDELQRLIKEGWIDLWIKDGDRVVYLDHRRDFNEGEIVEDKISAEV